MIPKDETSYAQKILPGPWGSNAVTNYGSYEYNDDNNKYDNGNNNISREYIKNRKLSSYNDAQNKEEVFDVDNNEILMKYMEKVDRDQSDLRNDIRESEHRTTERISSIEERMDNRLDRIEDMISEHTKSIDEKFSNLESKIDSNNKYIHNISISVMIGIGSISVATIVSLIIVLINLLK
jgi:hypothetical protein